MSSVDRPLVATRPWSATLAGWLGLARLSNSPTVATNVLAGVALAGMLEPSPGVALLAVAMVLFYTAGMVLNDVCDYAWDRSHRPSRPLVAGLVSRPAAVVALVLLFAIGEALLLLVGPRAWLAGLVLIGLIVIYDVWHKTNPLSPLLMALCRVLVYVTAFVAVAWPPSTLLVIASGLLAAHVIGLTAIAKSETRPSVVGYWPAALLLLPPLYFAFQVPPLALLLVVGHAAWIISSARLVYRAEARAIGGAIARLIAGISLLDGMVLAASGALLAVPLALLGFVATLVFQRYVEGT